MQSLSFDPAAASIGPQVVTNAIDGLEAGAAAATSLTGLAPAGADDVSMQTATAMASFLQTSRRGARY